MKILREVGVTVLIAVVVFVCLRLTVQSYTVVMSSMVPNIQEGEWIMVNKVCYRSSGPQRGEVIVFNPPPPNEESPNPFIKRVMVYLLATKQIEGSQALQLPGVERSR